MPAAPQLFELEGISFVEDYKRKNYNLRYLALFAGKSSNIVSLYAVGQHKEIGSSVFVPAVYRTKNLSTLLLVV